MTLRAQIEQAASELEQAASNEDEGVTLTWNRTTAINFALVEVEKATAELRSDIQEREIVVAEEKDALRAEYEFQLTEADRLAREECLRAVNALRGQYLSGALQAAIDDAAQAIRATIKPKP